MNTLELSPDKGEVMALLTQTNTFVDGHVLLSDGRHSSGYVTKRGLLQNPQKLYRIAECVIDQFDDTEYDLIVGPVNFGAQFAALCSLRHNKAFTMVYIPHDGQSYHPQGGRLHRDLPILEGQRAVIVDDWAISGDTVRNVDVFLGSQGIEVVGAGVIGNDPECKYSKMRSLFELPFKRWEADDCPICRSGLISNLVTIRE